MPVRSLFALVLPMLGICLLLAFAVACGPVIARPQVGPEGPKVVSGTVKIRGGELFYEMAGKGRSVVLLHGGLLDRRMWDGQFKLLAENYRVIRFDARGHGVSSVPVGDYSNYEDLHALLAALGVRRATLVGLSLGGRTAIDFALAYPGMVDAIVAVAAGMSGWKFEDPVLLEHQKGMQAAIEAKDSPMIVEWFQRSWTDGPKRTPGQVDSAVRDRVKAMARDNLAKQAAAEGRLIEVGATSRVGELRVPVLAIVGDLDMSDILGIADLLVANVPGAKKVVVPGVGHMVNLEKPAEFNRVLLDFLHGNANR